MRQAQRGDPMVRCFAPPNRSGLYIYALTLRAQPGVVKIGMTTNWRVRRKSYATWNLAKGDGIDESRVYQLHEEWADLPRIEADALAEVGREAVHGREWFMTTIDDASGAIERVLAFHDVSFSIDEDASAV